MKKQFLFPLAAILIATPGWAQTARVSLSTTALTFNGSTGNVSSQPITASNTGQTTVVIRSLSFSNAAFSIPSASLPITLSSGQRITGQVVAKPASGAQTGTLTIGTSAGNYTVALRETATAAQTAAHSANLTWSAPASETVPVDSYQVERAVSGSTDYSVVGTTTAGSTAFTDTSVAAGKSYVYEVRSVDDSGGTSDPSNVVTLAIP